MRRQAGLINRRNWSDTRRYLEYCGEVRQNKPETVEFCRGALDHLLRWAGPTPFPQVTTLRPTLPAYMDEMDVSPSYRQKILSIAREFLTWARERDERYSTLKIDFIDGLRSRRREGTIHERKVYTLDMVRSLVAVEPCDLAEERDRAAVAFLFLSGMRISAFTSLPVRGVDWESEPPIVHQWPAWGVRTKNDTAANTYLLATPELEDLRTICHQWHEKALTGVGERGMWYALVETDGQTFMPDQVPGEHRDDAFRRRLRNLCSRAGVEYLSPHKLRHGHVVYALSQCRTLADFKAVSQNVMHQSLGTTDAIYSGIMDADVARRIANLGVGRKVDNEAVLDELVEALFRRVLRSK